MKPGYQTSEFWGTIAAIVIGLGVNAGIIDSAAKDTLLATVNSIVGCVIAVVPLTAYIIGRNWAKAKNAEQVKNA